MPFEYAVMCALVPQQQAHPPQFSEHTPLPMSMPSIHLAPQSHEVPPSWSASLASSRKNVPAGHLAAAIGYRLPRRRVGPLVSHGNAQ